ncbi:protein low PSII accumulation 1, chloroplastic [Tanacetum coccineum]
MRNGVCWFLQVGGKRRHLEKDALVRFETALTLNPNPVEAQAALYNKACCHAYRGEGKKTADCLRSALIEYDFKFATILNDPDLASFRVLPEFKQLQEEARLGGEDVGYGFRRDLKPISDVQAPFRGVRKFFYVAFTEAAGISLFFTLPRLIFASQGGEGAPPISLQLLKSLPSILQEKVIWGEKESQIEKRGFGGPKKAAASLPSVGVQPTILVKTFLCLFASEKVDKEATKCSEEVTPGEDVYIIILRLDARVGRSGRVSSHSLSNLCYRHPLLILVILE